MKHIATIEIQSDKDKLQVTIHCAKKMTTFKVKSLNDAFKRAEEIVHEQHTKRPHVCNSECQNPHKNG